MLLLDVTEPFPSEPLTLTSFVKLGLTLVVAAALYMAVVVAVERALGRRK